MKRLIILFLSIISINIYSAGLGKSEKEIKKECSSHSELKYVKNNEKTALLKYPENSKISHILYIFHGGKCIMEITYYKGDPEPKEIKKLENEQFE